MIFAGSLSIDSSYLGWIDGFEFLGYLLDRSFFG
jgi:hypothetical protein